MSNWSKEKSGIDLLRSIALRTLNDSNVKKRIWSDKLESWGYFSGKCLEDDFLIWCGSSIGDRFCLGKEQDAHLVCVILANECCQDSDSRTRKVKLLGTNCQILEFEIEDSYLYRIGWDLLNKKT